METAMQLNAEIYRGLGVIAEDETLLRRAAKYIKKLAAKKEDDDSLMTKEEFLEQIRESEEQYRRGEYHTIKGHKELDEFLNRL